MIWRLLVILLAPAALFWRLGPWLWERWTAAGGYFGHAPLVPVFAVAWTAALVRSRRVVAGGAAWPAIGLGAAGAVGLFILLGRDAGFLGATGWWAATASLGVAALGWRGFRSLGGPLVFLGFLIPWPPTLVDDLSLPLKSLALDLGLLLVPAGAVQAGQGALVLPDGEGVLLVGEVCSGLRSAIAFLAAGWLVASASGRRGLRRTAVLVASVGAAVLANALRLAGLVVIAQSWGPGAAGPGSFAHGATGAAAVLAGLLAVIGVNRGLGAGRRRPVTGGPGVRGFPSPAWTVATLLVIGLGVGALAASRWVARDPEPAIPWELVPASLAPPEDILVPPFVGRDVPLDAGAAALLRPEAFLSRVYGDPAICHFLLVCGRGWKTQIHAPELCYQGSGYEVIARQELPFPDRFPGAPESLQEIAVVRRGEKMLTWYWYRGGGQSTASHAAFVWRTLWHPEAVQALTWVSCTIGADGESAARLRLRWALRQLSPALTQILSG